MNPNPPTSLPQPTLRELCAKATERGHQLAIERPLGFVGEPDLREMIDSIKLHKRLSPQTVLKVYGALCDADDDIREHLQVAEYNLTGKMHTGDQTSIPNPPLLIHREGINKSKSRREKLCQAILLLNGGTP